MGDALRIAKEAEAVEIMSDVDILKEVTFAEEKEEGKN